MPACEEIDGEEEEIVMTVLGSLEDLLYEPISIGGGDSDSSDDGAWNSCEDSVCVSNKKGAIMLSHCQSHSHLQPHPRC